MKWTCATFRSMNDDDEIQLKKTNHFKIFKILFKKKEREISIINALQMI